MEDKFIFYDVDGERFKIRESEMSEFEKDFQTAKVNMSVDGENFPVGINERNEFLKDFEGSTVSYTNFDEPEPQDTKPALAATMYDSDSDKKDDKTTVWESAAKGLGSSLAGYGLDALNILSSNNKYIDPNATNPYRLMQMIKTGKGPEMIETPDYDTMMREQSDPAIKAATEMINLSERWGQEADPTGGKEGFVDLIFKGKIGKALQKGVAVTTQSLPTTISARHPMSLVLNMINMAGRNYAKETLENPDMPKWKRGIWAVGSAAWEQVVEKYVDPFETGGATAEVTEEFAKELLENGVKEAVENIAKKITKRLTKNVAKKSAGEGVEEVVTSIGQDVIGEGLDLIDGETDYGIRAQWEDYKEEHKDATKGDFALDKAKEYFDSFIGGALSGSYMSGPTQIAYEGAMAMQDNDARKKFDNAREYGSTMDYGNIYDSNDDVARATDAVASAMPKVSRDFLDNLSAEQVFTLSRNQNIPAEQRQALSALANEKAKQEGLNQKLNERLEGIVNANRILIDAVAEDGNIVEATHNGKAVYVKGAQVNNDGTVSLPNGNVGPVIVVDARTGAQQTVNTNEISSAIKRDALEYGNEVAEGLFSMDEQLRETARTTMSPRAKMREVSQYAGKKMNIDLGNGIIEVEVQQILPLSGEVQIKGKKGDLNGNSITRIGIDAFYDSITRDDNGNPMFVEGSEVVEEEPIPTDEPTNEPIELTGDEDFREYAGPILINGVPTEVEVQSQDDATDSVVYTYTDENGNTQRGTTTVKGFAEAIQQAQNYQPAPAPQPEPAPVTEPIEEPNPIPAPVDDVPETPQPIDWDALFEQSPEDYFVEMQKQFGDKTEKRLNALIAATQKKLDALNKANPQTDNEILENEEKKEKLEAKIATLNEMVARLNTPVAEAPVTPETPATEEPVGEAPSATETPEPVVEEPVEQTPPAEPQTPEPEPQPVEQTKPVAPHVVDDPINESQKKESELIDKLGRAGLSHATKQDLARRAGKYIGDLFATREEYEAYEAVANDLGEYIDDFDKGIEDSFANRPKAEAVPQTQPATDASKLSAEAIALALNENASVNLHAATDEDIEQMMDASGADAEFMVASDKPIFVSNAAVAVEGIKQEKAIPEQWLKMIEKAGGLKAGEDKWMGLSDWLKASDKRTLTKKEVLDFIKENMIQIEEEYYSNDAEFKDVATHLDILTKLQEKFDAYVQEYWETHDEDDFSGTAQEYAIEKLREETNDVFPYDIELDNSDIYLTFTEDDSDAIAAWAYKLDIEYDPTPVKQINETRLKYTTEGLDNKKEIAIIIPTIDKWNQYDEIHFGDAGDGRAVAWVRFGDAKKLVSTTETIVIEEFEKPFKNYRGWDVYKPLGRKDDHMYISAGTLKDGRFVYGVFVKDTAIGAYESFDEAKDALNKYLAENPSKRFVNKRVLVIDEIQSKRHQEGREKGYDNEFVYRNSTIGEYSKYDEDQDVADIISAEGRVIGKMFRSSVVFAAENADGTQMTSLRNSEAEALSAMDKAFNIYGIPSAPFEKNWHELAMKRMLRYAAENGYDVIAWTNGEQQAERYSLTKHFSAIEREDNPSISGRRYKLYGRNVEEFIVDDNGVVTDSSISEAKNKPLSDVVGKELAEKMMAASDGDVLDDNDISLGGEGMRGFYDKMLPAFMNKYGKKWGIKVDAIRLYGLDGGSVDMHSVPVTQEMKDSVLEGQPMFMKRPNGKVYGWAIGNDIYYTKDGFNPNTLTHEYTHLWARAMMQKNPKGWQSIKDLLRGTPVWNEVLNDPNYSDIHNNEDLVASEVLSRISGRENAAKLDKMAQQMLDEANGTARKLEARGLIQRIKDALNQFWNWVGVELFGIENFESVEQITDRVLWDLMNKTDLGTLSEGQVETQIVTDPKVIEELEASPKRTGYRNVVKNEDGTYSSPMAYWLQSPTGGAKTRVETAKFEIGKWEEAEEHADLVDERGHITLVKPNKGTIDVAYDPYIHNRIDPVNLQFKDAWKRDELVYVETEVPETDLESGYHADKALLPVGVHSWSNGDLILSKYDKPVRVMPWEDVADAWVARLNGEGVHFDVVPPSLRNLLVERGIEILPPHKGMGKDCNDAYKAWKNDRDSDALLFRKKMIKDFSDMTAEELYDFLDEYEGQYSSYSTDGNAYHNYLKEPNKDIIEAIKKSIISNEIDEVGSSVVFVGDYAYLVDHLKPSELSNDSNGIGIIRKVNISGVEKSEKDLLKESIHAGRVRNRRDVNQWVSAYRAKRELYNRYFGSVEDAEAALVDGRLDWKELGERLLSRNEGSMEKGRLSTEIGKEVPANSTDIRHSRSGRNAKIVEQFEQKQNNERQELEYSDEFRGLQEESARLSERMVSDKEGVQRATLRGLVGRIGGTLQRELDRATRGRGYKFRTLVNESKGTSFDIIENIDGRLFHDIFSIVRTYLPNGELVDLHDNYDDAICYITSDGLAGFAVTADGNLISVYSLYGATKKGFLGVIKDLITEAGATRLDGYNSPLQPLAEIYSKVFGWKVASMMDYNMEYDHDNIAENHKMPQVAFMVNTDAEIETKHFDKDQYDEAESYQKEQADINAKVNTQNAAVDYLAGGARNFAIENAVNEEAAKLGVTVTYKTREEMPKGHKNDKGYFNTKTGEIVICTENASSIADAIQTILHEAVAHKGLRQLMGDRFNEFINRVYNSLDAETKAKVDALATANYNGNTAVAMEEYMASLAETTDFANNSVWDKIKSIFENIINSILGRNDIKIGDNELRYILRASYNNMVNPNSMSTIDGWAKDTNMRNELGINEATPELLSRTGIDPTEVSRETAKATYDRVVQDQMQEFQRQFQDAMQPVRIAIDAIQQETGNLPIEDYENFLLIQNQASSRSRVEIDDFARRYYSPIVEAVNSIIDQILESRGYDKKDKKKRADAYAEIRQYMIAKHGLERNLYYQSHNTRKLNATEKKKANAEAQEEYDSKVAAINADTTLSDAERELQLREALDEFNAAKLEIETREVPDLRDYSGLTALFGLEPKKYKKAEEEAQILIDNFEAQFGTSAEELWKRINKATDKTLRHSYECGLLSRQQYNDIKAMFNFYIPLRGFDETTAEDVYSYARFEGNRFNPAVQTAKGRTSIADDPLAIIMNMAESEIAQGNKNRAKQALYNFILNRPVTDAEGNQRQNSLMRVESVWYEAVEDAEGNVTYRIATPDYKGGETYEEFEERMNVLAEEDKAYKSKKGKVDVGMRFQKQQNRDSHYVYLKVNGVEKAIYINGDPKAAEAINGTYRPKPIYEKGSVRTKSEKINKVIEFAEENLTLSNINRILSSTFTNYSLEFTARNYFRDMIYSHINIDVKEADPAYRKKFRQNWRHNNLRSMMKLLRAYRAGELDGRALTEDEAAFVEFMNAGGQTGYTVINSVENHKRELERAIKNMQKGIEHGGVKDSAVFRATLGGIELLNECSELVTRFAAFKTSRDMGRSVTRAISDAKEVTVNFNTRGAQDGKGWAGMAARYLGWSKFFFNASVQGVQNLKAMRDANKLKFATAVGGVMAFGFTMPIIVTAISALLNGDDDDEDTYWNIPEYDRQNNFCVPVGGGKYVKIPLPIGFREIYAIGDMLAAAMFNKKFTRDVQQVGMDMANKIASVILPVNPLESSVNGLNFWHTFLYTALPSSAQFAVQNATNIDWKGAPLQKEYTYNENDPQWMKAYSSNPDWMVGLSKWCNEHIGAGDMEGMDWSPEKLDNTLSNLFGGIYTVVKKTGKTFSMVWNEENRNLSNVPLAGVALGSGMDDDDRFITDAYYDEKEYYDKRIGFIKRRAEKFGLTLNDVFVDEKGKHHPKMMEVYDNKEFDFMQEWYKGNKELDSLDNKIKRLEKKETLTSDESQKLVTYKAEYETKRREFVLDMLELD